MMSSFYDSQSGYDVSPDTLEEWTVYTYIRSLAKLSAEDAVAAFYQLLWQGNAYPRDDVKGALQRVVAAPHFKEHQLKIINRCYYTLVNRWHLDGARDQAIAKLILWLDHIPADRGQNAVTRTLRDALRSYQKSDYYDVLRRNLYLLEGWKPYQEIHLGDRPFVSLLPEYFFIYEASTRTSDIENAADQLNDGIIYKRNQKICQYRQDLSRFYKSYTLQSSGQLPPPTQQLTSEQLCYAIKLYSPRRNESFRLQADQFKRKVKKLRTVGEWKQVIQQHAMQPIQHLNPTLQRRFRREFSQALHEFDDGLPMTRTIEIQIFSRLLNAIARDDNAKQEGAQFSRFLTAVGPAVITSLLLNLVLSCRMVRFDLEKRFADLHHKFAKVSQATVQWLVEAFDYMNVALALNARYLTYFSLISQGDPSIPNSV
jgi:hypothetical protein